jgi:hypothetical protein
MPILYEDVFKTQKAKSLATAVKDTEMSITITMAAGKATITDAYAFDAKSLTKISKAYPGQVIGLQVNYRNDGDTDIIWATIKDKDTGIILVNSDGIAARMSISLSAGNYGGWSFNNVVMPSKNFNLLIEAGHGS